MSLEQLLKDLAKKASRIPDIHLQEGLLSFEITSATQTITLSEPLQHGITGLWLVKYRIDGVAVTDDLPDEAALYLVITNLPKVERRSDANATTLANQGHPLMLEHENTCASYLTAAPQISGSYQRSIGELQIRVVNKDSTDAKFDRLYLELQYAYTKPDTIVGLQWATNNQMAQGLAAAAVPYYK
jgi:hypothetical protein